MAIKVIHAGDHDRAGQRRLEREGRAVVALRHPGIVAVYELRQTASGAALVMEYAPGGDLRALMDSGTLTGPHAAALLGEMAAALTHAHAAGIVHRDVKPANVLITADGHAKIADFGLARLTRTPGAYRTSAAGVSGTPAYMAPEQILDPSTEVSGSDTYAFAVLAYELLTGARPFPAHGVAEVIAAHLYAAPIPPWQIAPGLDAQVAQILLWGLAKRPQDRPSPAQIAEQIRRVTPAQWDAFFRTRVPPTGPDSETEATATPTVGATTGLGADPAGSLAAPEPARGPEARSPGAAAPAHGKRAPGIPVRVRTRTPTRRWRLAAVLAFALAGSVLGLVLVVIARRL